MCYQNTVASQAQSISTTLCRHRIIIVHKCAYIVHGLEITVNGKQNGDAKWGHRVQEMDHFEQRTTFSSTEKHAFPCWFCVLLTWLVAPNGTLGRASWQHISDWKHWSNAILTSQGLRTWFGDPGRSAWAEQFLELASLIITELSSTIWVELIHPFTAHERGNMIGWQPPSILCDSRNAGQLFKTSWISTHCRMRWYKAPGKSCDWLRVSFRHHVKSVQLRPVCQGLWNRVLRPWLVRMV